jgi:hypothetical protein
MFSRSCVRIYQVGAHVPHSAAFRGATMKAWPRSAIPTNFQFLPEQRLAIKPLPRDTGRVPRNFVLRLLYLNQPVVMDDLWNLCTNEAGCVLDSKRHLREVLKTCRDESFVYFDRHPDTGAWVCNLARERYEEVKAMVVSSDDRSPAALGMRGAAAQATAASLAAVKFENASTEPPTASTSDEIPSAEAAGTADAAVSGSSYHNDSAAAQEAYIAKLRQAVAQSQDIARRFRRVDVDYLPYTDLNGKVKFMWWYDTQDGPAPGIPEATPKIAAPTSAQLGAGGEPAALPSGGQH